LIKRSEPIIVGIPKLINHNKKVEEIIPMVFSEKMPIKNMARDPRIPSSAKVVVGNKVENK